MERVLYSVEPHLIKHTVMKPHAVWSVDEGVDGPHSQATVNSSSFQLLLKS